MKASHETWLRHLKAAATAQKTFQVLDPDGRDTEVHEIDISILADEAGAGDSSAERTGWTIDVRYSQAPDVVLFSNTYPTQELAQQVMDDLCRASAEVSGLIKKTDMDGAKEAMAQLKKIFTSSSAEPPAVETPGSN